MADVEETTGVLPQDHQIWWEEMRLTMLRGTLIFIDKTFNKKREGCHMLYLLQNSK